MGSSVNEFLARAVRIPVHGIGLSVDAYSPDLLELHQALDRAGTRPDYLEIFKAPTPELTRIRAALPEVPLAYHAEGLWLTEPELQSKYPWTDAIETIARHAEAIGAGWVNHECAAKQFGGYSFGTYLPPLFTDAAARTTAANAVAAQVELDERYAQQDQADSVPLLLLELPPLTYFAFGDLTVSEFFARILETCPCGLVLDIGHLWTVWWYRERRRFRSLEAFATDFLDAFPLDRVVQIHLAGLGVADGARGNSSSGTLPCWVDAHAAPVPAVLFDLLRQVLAHPGLTSLKGIALEVDTKAIPLSVEEFGRLRENVASQVTFSPSPISFPLRGESTGEGRHDDLPHLYQTYAHVVSGQEPLGTSALAPYAWGVDSEGLARYTNHYLPNELLHWGGDLADLFPAIWKKLEEGGISGGDFVRFWFKQPRPVTEPYDFFYVKLERWVAFVGDVAPDLVEEATREAGVLRALHSELNDEEMSTPSLALPPRGGGEGGGRSCMGRR